MAVTRGFLGRKRDRDPRLPPGQYDVGADWPVLTAEPTPRIRPEDWSVTVDGRVETPTTWTGDGAHRPPAGGRPPHRRGALRHGDVEDRLHHESAAGRRHRRQGVAGLGVRRPSA